MRALNVGRLDVIACFFEGAKIVKRNIPGQKLPGDVLFKWEMSLEATKKADDGYKTTDHAEGGFK